MKKQLIMLCGLFGFYQLQAQPQSKRVLFIGNSYTYHNNLPERVYQYALSSGDQLYIDKSVPGGYTLQQHWNDANTISKIKEGNWDCVVLQEQSQLPSFPIEQVEADVFPYARKLDSLIKSVNPCTRTMFYMTWGRQNGDASNCPFWPPVCTYQGMDSLLNLRYTMMAKQNQAILCPVGKIWNVLMKKYPKMSLFSLDGSHPDSDGTQTAALCFYTLIYNKSPKNINKSLRGGYVDSAANVVESLISNHLSDWDFAPKHTAKFYFRSVNDNTIEFTDSSKNSDKLFWYFDDGQTSTQKQLSHVFLKSGKYKVVLTSIHCKDTQTYTEYIQISKPNAVDAIQKQSFILYPNPSSNYLNLEQQFALDAKIKIVDISGRTWYEGTCNGNKTTIPIDNLKPGQYRLMFQNKEAILNKFFIKL